MEAPSVIRHLIYEGGVGPAPLKAGTAWATGYGLSPTLPGSQYLNPEGQGQSLKPQKRFSGLNHPLTLSQAAS